MDYTCFSDEENKHFAKKKDFIIYKNNLTILKRFNSESAYKELWDGIIQFCNGDNEFPTFSDIKAAAAFEVIKNGIIENTQKYTEKCLINKENSKKKKDLES